MTSTTITCPRCDVALSVRDMKDLIPKSPQKSDQFTPKKGSSQATHRLKAELKQIYDSKPEIQGYSAAPIDDNLYNWKIKLFGFDSTELDNDLNRLKKKKYILLHAVFPQSFPFEPPFIRVIRPRFQFRTGHVTIGGSVCMELLTKSGWSPANTMEAVILSIRLQLIEGGARLDRANKQDYTEQEAKVAFDRMVREHGW
eukprot:TRINITY_DN2199_c0_g1_i1.p1 TRINITY_DN2199_c0_g1~~TRINITY_DN2199_c0_g1_i1.p1  ORF type:complete len:199 (-),score=25.79 TRINITY_DN2199_c0_g1_i1:77-673(-)